MQLKQNEHCNHGKGFFVDSTGSTRCNLCDKEFFGKKQNGKNNKS